MPSLFRATGHCGDAIVMQSLGVNFWKPHMKYTALFFALLACIGQAHAAKSCEELKTEVAAKLDAKGVKGYALELVSSDKVGDAKVVGSCDGGKKKLTYAKKKKA
jgi:hypothetical protein